METYEKQFPHYRSHLAQKHKKKLNDKGAIDIKLTQLGIKKPCTARHYYIKEQVEVTAHFIFPAVLIVACINSVNTQQL